MAKSKTQKDIPAKYALYGAGIILIVVLLVSLNSGFKTTKIQEASANDISLGPAKWGYKWGGNYPSGTDDCRIINIQRTCNSDKELYVKEYLDGKIQNLMYATGSGDIKLYEKNNCLRFPWLDFGSGECIDSSVSHTVKLCWGLTEEELNNNPKCDSITTSPFACKKYNESCSSYNVADQGKDNKGQTNDCCGISGGSKLTCTQETSQDFFFPTSGTGVCKRQIIIDNQGASKFE